MVVCAHILVVYVDREEGSGDTLYIWGSESCLPVKFRGKLTHTVVPCAQKVVVCVAP